MLTHDEANRLTGMEYRDANGGLVQELGYEYDLNGSVVRRTRSNAVSVPETPMVAEYDAANRMTRITIDAGVAGARTYALSYDEEGNLTRKENVADPNDASTYEWDSRSRLVRLSTPGVEAQFAYDAIGRRIGKTLNGESVAYVYDGLQAIGEIVNGQVSATLLTGTQIDETIARFTDAGARTFLADLLGSVIAQTSETSQIQATYFYSPYGESSAQGGGLGNSVQYTGRENDATGLYFYRARYYDPALKRFIASDPIGLDGGLNTYAYVDGDPLFQIDPLGLFGWRDAAGFIPVVGSVLDAVNSFKCGNIGMGILNSVLALTNLTGGGALVKGILVGGFKLSQRTLLKEVYKKGRKMDYANVRQRMLGRGLMKDGAPTHHILPQRWDWIPDRVMNHPMNLMPNIARLGHDAAHSGNPINFFAHGMPLWAKGAVAGAGSSAAGLAVDCGCE